MKRILYIIAFAAALLAASSCVEPLAPVILDKDQDFTLSFSCGVMTKATVEGDGNENLVKRIDYFVFPYGTNGKVADTDECAYSGTIDVTDDPSTTVNEQLALSYTATIPHDKLVDIFPDGNTKAVVFAVANYVDKFGANNSLASPNTTLPAPENGEKYTWGELHAIEVGATFFYDDGTGKTIAKVTIKNIPVQSINDDFKINVYEGTGYAGTITYSPMNYCYNVISREITATRTEALKLNVSAYILFYQKASEYINNL